MSGGKGGSQTSQVTIPDWVKGPASRNLARAESLARVGYVPYYGGSVAAFTPMQEQAMQTTADAASAFGLAPQMDAMAGMPQSQDFNGVQGYGTGQMFEQALADLAANQPQQLAAFNNQFIGPRPDGLLGQGSFPQGAGPAGPRDGGFFPSIMGGQF